MYILHMKLLIKADSGFEDLVKEYYSTHGSFHSGDCGLDLFCLQDVVVPPNAYSFKLPLGVCMEAIQGCGFYLYPRSSTGSKTPLRLSNSVGIIDPGYRGPLTAIIDNVSNKSFVIKKGERYFQVCAPNLEVIEFELVKELSDSTRGSRGFGSTGN